MVQYNTFGEVNSMYNTIHYVISGSFSDSLNANYKIGTTVLYDLPVYYISASASKVGRRQLLQYRSTTGTLHITAVYDERSRRLQH